MGIIYIIGYVSNNKKKIEVKFFVDSGISYSFLPRSICQKIGLSSKRNVEFILSDSSIINRGVSECYIQILGREGHTPVILGEKDEEEALLGSVTLVELGLVLDPFKREIRPAKKILI